MLLVVTFRGFQSDHKDFDRFARTWFHFTETYDETVGKGDILIVEPAFRSAKDWADKEGMALFGEHTAQRRASVLFLLIASAIWFGIVNASREIVSEKIHPETGDPRVSEHLSYLTAKVFVLFVIAFSRP